MGSDKARVALFGGTFDPIHDGHLILAKDALHACSLERVIFIPCYQSPHKPGIYSAPGEDRLEMLKLATRDLPWAEVSNCELVEARPSYSWETARLYTRLLPDADLYWILGADQWEVIDTWARPDFLAEHLHFIVFPRKGSESPAPKEGFRATFLDTLNPASATAIRDALADGDAAGDQLIPPEVAAYIEQRQLYRNPSA